MPDLNGKWSNPIGSVIQDYELRATSDSLTKYLGGWVNDTGRQPIILSNGVAETRGNADVTSTYRVFLGDMVWWYGHYNVGTTTAWSVAGVLTMIPPIPVDTITFQYKTASMPGSTVRAYNGTFHHGFVEFTGASSLTLYDAATAASQWGLGAATPFAWGAGSILSWNILYRADARVRQ